MVTDITFLHDYDSRAETDGHLTYYVIIYIRKYIYNHNNKTLNESNQWPISVVRIVGAMIYIYRRGCSNNYWFNCRPLLSAAKHNKMFENIRRRERLRTPSYHVYTRWRFFLREFFGIYERIVFLHYSFSVEFR